MKMLHQAAHAGFQYFVEIQTLFASAACVCPLLGVIASTGESIRFGLLYPICSLCRAKESWSSP